MTPAIWSTASGASRSMAPSIVRSAPTLKYFSYSDASTTTRTEGSSPSSVNAPANSCIRSSAIELLPLRCMTTRAVAPSRLTSTHSPIRQGSGGEERYAAGDLDDGAGDVAGLFRAQEGDRVGDVFRLAEALEHRSLLEALVHRVVFGRRLTGLALDDARRDRIGGDVVAPALEGSGFRQPDNGCLGRRVA